MSLGISHRQGEGRTGFTLHLEIKDDSGAATHYKFDGARFSGGDSTVKLVSGSNYILRLTCTPPLTIESCRLCGDYGQDEELKPWTPDEDTEQPLDANPEAQPVQPTQPSEGVLIDFGDEGASQAPSLPQPAHGLGFVSSTAQPASHPGGATSDGVQGGGAHHAGLTGASSGVVTQGGTPPAGLEAATRALAKARSEEGISTWGWSCEWPPSQKSARTHVQLKIQTEELGLAELPLLVKVYKEWDKQQYNGSKLRHVQFLLVPHPELDRQLKLVSTCFFSLP